MPDLSTLSERIDAGLVIEATDPARAAGLAASLGQFLTQMTAGQQGISVGSETVAGVETTVLGIEFPVDPTTTLAIDLLLGASDEIFFLGTRPAVERILTGDGTLPGNALYNEALALTLPNPTSLWYADGEGLLISTSVGAIVPLALLGPAIGNVFDNIVTELQAEGGMIATAVPTATPT